MKELLELYWTFVRIGLVTFGGGYAMLPILERELADKRHWTNMDELRDYFSIGQCTPGIIAMNVSTFIGEKRKGVRGAIAFRSSIRSASSSLVRRSSGTRPMRRSAPRSFVPSVASWVARSVEKSAMMR